MKKVIFLHGFLASGQCALAQTLREGLEGKAIVIAPDLPLHPDEVLAYIHDLCIRERPDLLVANSCGSFYAQILAPIVGVPALLGNPHLEMTDFLRRHMGQQSYKSPRRDGRQSFVVDERLIAEFAALQQHQFDFTSLYYKERIWGLFGEHDTVAHYEPLFREHYPTCYHFPGGHAPTDEEVLTWYVPLAEKMLLSLRRPEAGERYFRHFKGGLYRLDRFARDCESQDRLVVYQALYGERGYWVRPEDMFFGHIVRDGKIFSRFLEVDADEVV